MTENRMEKAVFNHCSGYNCSQAVACAFCDKVEASEELIFQIIEGYGFGMGCMEGACGALSGTAKLLEAVVFDSRVNNGGNDNADYRCGKRDI